MNASLPLVLLTGPLVLAAASVVSRVSRIGATLAVARVATLASVVASLGGAALLVAAGPSTSSVVGFGAFGLSVRLDVPSVSMSVLVAFLGAVIVAYCRNHLSGDPRQGEFVGKLCSVLASVLLLVVAGNTVQLLAAWIATSVALHGLLLFYPERKVAVAAARKKFALARAADACLAVALFLLFRATGTTDILATNESIARHGSSTWSGLAATLVVLAAIFKSAQLPFSGWLFEVVETPTPVSALLHAGLLNGGAFLVMRLSGVVSQSTVATSVLVVVGATTAALLSLSMTAQPAIKISLAHSSAAHMGYTLMLAGLGAYSFALLHLVAHSCYKAHAFLSTGTTVKDVAARPAPVGKSFGAIVLYVLGAGLVFAGMTRLLGIATDGPVDGARSVVFVLGLTLLFARSATLSGRPATLATALTAAATTLVFLALERIVWLASSTSFAHAVGATSARVALSAFVVGIFSTTAVVQLRHHGWGRHSTWRVFYVWLKNGFFLNSFVDRAIGSFVVPAPVTLPSPDSQRS